MSKMLVGRYELIEKIGEGGMAVVYRAKDRLLNRYVAVKILRPEYTRDVQFVESFRNESQAAAGLQHPNIISVYDVGREGNIHFIVMELVDGISLSEYIKEMAPMDYREVVNISKQVCSALIHAHSHNIIHRDVKPHNIMLTRDGTAKLGDFGIAKAISNATLTETSKIIGSVHYFSPEQARGSYVDERSDIYSLGIIMYEMLTGQVPFDGENPVQVALMHINNDIEPPSHLVKGIPPALEKVVMKATNRFQANRYSSAEEMLEDLKNVEFVTRMVGPQTMMQEAAPVQEEAAVQEENVAKAADAAEENEKNKKKKKKRIILIVILAAALCAVGAFALSKTVLNKTTVPDVTGMDYTAAKRQLKTAGFRVKRGDNVVSDDVEKGHVASQDPDAGTKVSKGSVITLNISAGRSTSAVPDLVGKQYDEASISALLKNAGFELGEVTEEKSDEYEKNVIMRQTPSGGSSAEEGTKVNIVICSGKKTEEVSVPSLTGLTLEEAKSKLASAGLTLGGVNYSESTVYEDGYIMWQEYDAGTSVKKGTSVSVRIAKSSQTDNSGSSGSSDGGSSGTETHE